MTTKLPLKYSTQINQTLLRFRFELALLKELAIALYAQELLSFGKACELANLDHRQFGQLLGERHISRHYTETELAEDLGYVRCQ